VDYKVLGLELTGAPDNPHRLEEGQVTHYPLKVFVKPHWFPHLDTIDWADFKLWTWIGGAKAIGGPISEDSESQSSSNKTGSKGGIRSFQGREFQEAHS